MLLLTCCLRGGSFFKGDTFSAGLYSCTFGAVLVRVKDVHRSQLHDRVTAVGLPPQGMVETVSAKLQDGWHKLCKHHHYTSSKPVCRHELCTFAGFEVDSLNRIMHLCTTAGA
jgi:hypothetical protein